MDIHGPLQSRGETRCREESASPAWLAAPAMNARDTTKVYIWRLDTGCGTDHYIGSVTVTTCQEKGIITLESNPSRGTVPPAPHGKGNKCDKNVKYKRRHLLNGHNKTGTQFSERTKLITR